MNDSPAASEPLIPTIARMLARNTARRLLVLADVDGAAPDVVERALDRAVAETAEQFHDEARMIIMAVLDENRGHVLVDLGAWSPGEVETFREAWTAAATGAPVRFVSLTPEECAERGIKWNPAWGIARD